MRFLGNTSLVRNLVGQLEELNQHLATEGEPARVRYLQLLGTSSDRLIWMLHWELWDVPSPMSINYLVGYRNRGEKLFESVDHPVNSGFWDPAEIGSAEAARDNNPATTQVWAIK